MGNDTCSGCVLFHVDSMMSFLRYVSYILMSFLFNPPPPSTHTRFVTFCGLSRDKGNIFFKHVFCERCLRTPVWKIFWQIFWHSKTEINVFRQIMFLLNLILYNYLDYVVSETELVLFDDLCSP